MEFLVGLLCMLAFITLLGHGIWVLLAKLVHFLSAPVGEPLLDPSGPRPRERCHTCGKRFLPTEETCRHCGRKRTALAEWTDLQVTLRQLKKFQQEGLLSEEELERLRVHIVKQERKLLGYREPQPVPVEPPAREPATVGLASVQVQEPRPPEPILELLPVQEVAAAEVPVLESVPPREAAEHLAHAIQSEEPASPRRSVAEWFAAFMEERNILWGELIGGLLMVGCSLALVLSLWQTLEKIPLFPFLVLAALTTALFAIGRYTLHHWKLTATSHGLLVIATLLVPLNFLVLAGLSRGAAGGLLELVVKSLAVVGFAWLVGRAGGTLLQTGASPARPPGWLSEGPLLVLAVVGTAASQLPLRRLVDPLDPGAWFVLVGAWAVACHGLGVGGLLGRRASRQPLADREATSLLAFLGLATFALVLALGFLGFWVASQRGPLNLALERLAFLVALGAVPVLAVGLVIRRATARAEPGSTASHLLLIGTGVALAGMTAMLAALVLAWPEPAALLLVCALDFVVLTLAAFLFELPLAHALALVSLAAGYLTAYHLGAGHLAGVPQDLRAATLGNLAWSGDSGVALATLFAGVVLAAEGMRARGRTADSFFYSSGACVLAGVSLVLVGLAGGNRPGQGALVYGLYAAAALFLGRRWRWAWLDQAGAALALVATLWGLQWGYPGEYSRWTAVLALESLLFSVLAGPWWVQALAAALLALVTSVLGPELPRTGWHTLSLCAMTGAALVQAGRRREPAIAWIGSGLLLAALAHALLVCFTDLGLWLPGLATVLVHATLVQAAGLALRAWRPAQRAALAVPLGDSALVTLTLAGTVLLTNVQQAELTARALYCAWLAGLLLAHTVLDRRFKLFPVFQAALVGSVLFAVAGILVDQPWVRDRFPDGLGDPRSLQAFGLGLAGLSLAWGVVRLWLRSHPRAAEFLETNSLNLDRFMLGGVVIGQAVLAVWGLVPGLLREMMPSGAWSTVTPPVFGANGWLLVSTLTVVLVVWLWEARTAFRLTAVVLGLVIQGVTVAVLAAGLDERETATALRWSLGACFLALSLPLWLRRPLAHRARALGIVTEAPLVSGRARALMVACTVVPVVALSAGTGLLLVSQLGRAAPGSIPSLLLPLGMVLAGLTGHALRERSQGFAFAAGLVANLIVVEGYAVAHVLGGGALSERDWVFLLQLGTITAAVWDLGWLAVITFGPRLLVGGADSVPVHQNVTLQSRAVPPRTVQVLLAVAGNLILILLPLPNFLADPGRVTSPEVMQVGTVAGWLALGLTLSALALGHGPTRDGDWRFPVAGALLPGWGILLACTLAPYDHGNWLSYHTLMLVWTLTAWIPLLASLANLLPAPAFRLTPWLPTWAGLAVALALRGAWEDPARPYPSCLAVLAISLWAGVLSPKGGPAYVVVSGLLLNLVGVLAWIAAGPDTLIRFFWVNVLGLALASTTWTLVRRLQVVLTASRNEGDGSPFVLDNSRPFRHWASLQSAFVLALLSLEGLPNLAGVTARSVPGPLAWWSLLAVAVALGLCLWDAGARFPLPALYGVGLAAISLGVQGLEREPESLVRAGLVLLAGYVLATSLLAYVAPRLDAWRQVLRLPPWGGTGSGSWFAPTQTVVACLVLFPSLAVALVHDTTWDRLSGPLAVALLLPAGVLLAERARGSWRRELQYASLMVAVLLPAEVGWALIDPSTPAPGLHRAVALLTALALATVFHGFALPRLVPAANEWATTGRNNSPVLGLAASVVGVGVVWLEGLTFDPATRHTPLGVPAVGAGVLAWLGLVAAGIALAVTPRIDTLELSDPRRRYYVYGSELLLVCLFLHLRCNVPEIFPKFLGPYWTFLVMLLAFGGVGLGELFRRRRLDVLAGPLEQTGVFLPLLPLLVFWLHPPAAFVTGLGEVLPRGHPLLRFLPAEPSSFGSYASLWFLFGLLYAWLSVSRNSFRYGLLAALAANMGLWVLLHGYGTGFLVHPQLWLIPLALIVLVSEILNRPHLSPEASTGLRYLGLGMLYLSSTADLFITGLGNSVVLPLVLAVLCVLGVLAGILLRVRSYLYLGVGFLVVDLFSMIWHAAVDLSHVWVWWVSGIVLGAAILALFALFEKRRQTLQHLVEGLRTWQH